MDSSGPAVAVAVNAVRARAANPTRLTISPTQRLDAMVDSFVPRGQFGPRLHLFTRDRPTNRVTGNAFAARAARSRSASVDPDTCRGISHAEGWLSGRWRWSRRAYTQAVRRSVPMRQL